MTWPLVVSGLPERGEARPCGLKQAALPSPPPRSRTGRQACLVNVRRLQLLGDGLQRLQRQVLRQYAHSLVFDDADLKHSPGTDSQIGGLERRRISHRVLAQTRRGTGVRVLKTNQSFIRLSPSVYSKFSSRLPPFSLVPGLSIVESIYQPID